MCFFFFNDPATTEIYTLSLHDALPICGRAPRSGDRRDRPGDGGERGARLPRPDGEAPARHHPARASGGERKKTPLNSSHVRISYALLFFKKKKWRPLKLLFMLYTSQML